MKILLTIHHRLDINSGAPGTVLKLGQIYQQQGHEVYYLSHDNLPKGLSGKLFPFFAAISIHQLNKKYQFDVIDASTGDAWIWGTFIRRFAANKPLLVTRSHGLEHSVHLSEVEESKRGNLHLSWKYPFYHGGFLLWEVANSLRCADLVFLLNKQDLQYANEVLGVPIERLYITPNGIPDEFLNLPFESLPTSDSLIKIACIGSYINRKGIQYSVPALNRILDRNPNVSVSFLGTICPEEIVYNDFKPSVRSQVHVLPNFLHSTLPNLLKGFSIKLFTPICEGFGKALIEAMSCGLAPVTTKAEGPLDIVRDGYDALLVPLRDSIAIEEALERLINNRSYLEEIRCNAYTTAQKYSWTNAANQRLSLYSNNLIRNHV
jgi:glycosyltransferase involved in cell wall biosynthesis